MSFFTRKASSHLLPHKYISHLCGNKVCCKARVFSPICRDYLWVRRLHSKSERLSQRIVERLMNVSGSVGMVASRVPCPINHREQDLNDLNRQPTCAKLTHKCRANSNYFLNKGLFILPPLDSASVRHYSSKVNTKTFSLNNSAVQSHIQHTLKEYDELTDQLVEPRGVDDALRKELGKRHWKLTPLAEKIREYEKKKAELVEIHKLLDALDKSDGDMLTLAKQEEAEFVEKMASLEDQILLLMVPEERTDDRDVVLEVSAGVGGQEAMLFCLEIFEMYQNYAASEGWDFDLLEYETTDLGGLRKACASISGKTVYKRLKFECGVHRVQRVPKTEKSGRVHTSTMTVAVLPQPDEIDVVVKPGDLRIDTYRASGKGGQHVNKTESAVRITHIPTGVVAECQTERSQLHNREKAMKVLLSRLFQAELNRQTEQRQSTRKLQVGSGGRSEKIRTYNYSQDRVTDHRLKMSVHNLADFLIGGENFHEMMKMLQEEDKIEALTELLEKYKSR